MTWTKRTLIRASGIPLPGCDHPQMLRAMTDEDFDWAARLMEKRRAMYEAFSPVFWRPALDVVGQHAAFIRSVTARPGALALRTEHAFLLSFPHEGRTFVDDFAVEADGQWETEGRDLVAAAVMERRSFEPTLRVVTARQDTAKRALLASLGLVVAARWWVKELQPSTVATIAVAEVDLDVMRALFVPAPPVYDPGGPVCILGDVESATAVAASTAAERLGAVLAIVQRDPGDGEAAETEPVLEEAGFHNPSEFHQGILVDA